MKQDVPVFALIVSTLLLHGCASDASLAGDIRQTRLQTEALNQRVNQLETSRGGGSVAYADTGTPSSDDASSAPESTDTTFRASGAFSKLGRGAVNALTGWVEVPKRILETSDQSGYFAGFTWGLLRGLGYGFVRTAAGGYEILTFPVAAPPDYEPVIQPEYVFSQPPAAIE